MNLLVVSVLVGAFFFVSILMFFASCYKRCASNQIIAIYGKVGKEQSVKCFHGGGAFIIPLIQDAKFLDLTPMTISIPLKGALSFQNIRINVPSTFTIAIDTSKEAMNNAAVRLLGLTSEEVERMASEIIFGQLRLTVASLNIEEINQDRERFLQAIRNNIEPELRKIGLTLINVNITDITDESDYIESIGKKAASTAVNQAKIDVAEQEKKGDVGASAAERERRIQVASYNAEAVEGENTSKAKVASYDADLAEKEAEAGRRGEVAEQNAVAEIQKAKALAEIKRLEAEQIVPKEIDKRKVEIQADADAEKLRREAKGKADAIVSVKTAQAEGIQKVLDAKAEGYHRLVNSCGDNAKDAATMLLVEKLEEIIKLQVEAIRNIKIDKVVVWDSGHGEKGSSTANFMSSLVKSLPALHDVSAMAGVELPDYLGKIVDDAKIKGVKETRTRTSAPAKPQKEGDASSQDKGPSK
ncbi:MAG: flotillin family protein [Candidatus Omnitrophica bacterium]|nr:flotillin family protein [Candidatus Omnitrophota bacterium]